LENYQILLGIFGVFIAFGFFCWLHEKRRKNAIKKLSKSLNFSYIENGSEKLLANFKKLYQLPSTSNLSASNILIGSINGIKVTIMEILMSYEKKVTQQTVILFESDNIDLPSFICIPENSILKFSLSILGYNDIDYDSNPKFSKSYLLSGSRQNEVRKVFNNKVLDFFENNKNLYVMGNNNKLMIYQTKKRIPVKNIKTYLENYLNLIRQLN